MQVDEIAHVKVRVEDGAVLNEGESDDGEGAREGTLPSGHAVVVDHASRCGRLVHRARDNVLHHARALHERGGRLILARALREQRPTDRLHRKHVRRAELRVDLRHDDGTGEAGALDGWRGG